MTRFYVHHVKLLEEEADKNEWIQLVVEQSEKLEYLFIYPHRF